jgi:hypothetical protein
MVCCVPYVGVVVVMPQLNLAAMTLEMLGACPQGDDDHFTDTTG